MNLTRNRAGKGGFGCVSTIVVMGLIMFFGSRFLKPWIHYQQFRDEMRSNARFATTLADSVMLIRLRAQADTLGLPAEAKKISIRHIRGRPNTITISAEYTEKVKLPIFGIKLLRFKPKVEEPL